MAPTSDYLATKWRQQVAHGVSRGICLHPNRLPRMGNAVHDFHLGISRFGVSHGCAGETVASDKTANDKSFTSLETFHGVAYRG